MFSREMYALALGWQRPPWWKGSPQDSNPLHSLLHLNKYLYYDQYHITMLGSCVITCSKFI